MSNFPLRGYNLSPDRREHWRQTPADEPRGFIQPHALDELWLHTGTACNLACPFCLEGSKPGDDRLQLLRFRDAIPFIDEALALGVKQFSFTGGEPFINKDLIRILDYALQYRPCLVLTNATEPLIRRLRQLKPLRNRRHALSFRVSLDYPDAARHDAGRGEGMFTSDSLETFGGYGVIEVPDFQRLLRMICERGFEHHVAATRATVAEAVYDGLDTYLRWDVYRHG